MNPNFLIISNVMDVMKGKIIILGLLIMLSSFAMAQKSIQNAFVMVEWSDGKHSYMNYTSTNSTGYYEINVAPGTINVSAGFHKIEGNEILIVGNFSDNFSIEGTKWLNFTLPPFPKDTARIYGHIYDNETHEGIKANLTIMFEDPHHKYAGKNYTFSSNDGYYEINLPPSNVMLSVVANGYFEKIEYIEIGNEEKLLNIYLEPMEESAAVIKGYVMDENSNIIPNATIVVLKGQGSDITYYNSTFTQSGYYVINVPFGNLALEVTSTNYITNITFCNVTEQVTWINISLKSMRDGAWIAGYVLDENGMPIPNAGVTVNGGVIINGIVSYYKRNATTDANGQYNISIPAPIPPIDSIIYDISANATGYFENTISLFPTIVPFGQVLRVNITLDKKPDENCSVRGYVYMAESAKKYIMWAAAEQETIQAYKQPLKMQAMAIQ